jgi:hypothetical protein
MGSAPRWLPLSNALANEVNQHFKASFEIL